MYKTYPWIQIHYIPANCTGLFQACDVGIQRVLKLAIKHSALCQGVTPSNSKGGLPAPEARARTHKRERLQAKQAQQATIEAHMTKQRPGVRVDSVPSQSREEPDQEASLKKEAESRGQPLVIDKTKEIYRGTI